MTNEQNKINARRIVDEGWNKHNSKVLDELFTNDAILHNPQDPTVIKGPQGAKTSVDTYLTAFPDLKITIEKEIADGDYVVQHLRAIGTNTGQLNGMPATGKKANTTGAMTTKFDNGKIVEVGCTAPARVRAPAARGPEHARRSRSPSVYSQARKECPSPAESR